MAASDSAPFASAAVATTIPTPLSVKENGISLKITELTESRQEILNRIQNLKQDLQSWRSKLDNQVKVYQEELSELRKSLKVEVDQLQTEFQDLRTTLQEQQEDVTASLKDLGLQDTPGDIKEAKAPNGESNDKTTSLPREDEYTNGAEH